MSYKDILSERNQDINKLAASLKEKYFIAEPFPHIQINNFFSDVFLNDVLDEFPDLSNFNNSQNYKNQNEIKFANNDYNKFSNKIKLFFDFLNSDEFLNFLQNITSIKEKLYADLELNGGGLHEIKSGGLLKVHTDFNKHPFKKLDRRLNVLIYLNKNWKESYSGHLELWNKNMNRCVQKILPTFNTMVIFSTNDFTNHGHPNYLKCPKDISRKSVATYYFSKGRPKEETVKIYKKNRTEFKNRVGINNDVLIKREYIKNIFRNLTIYQSIKNFEKKYIRKGNSKKKRKN